MTENSWGQGCHLCCREEQLSALDTNVAAPRDAGTLHRSDSLPVWPGQGLHGGHGNSV